MQLTWQMRSPLGTDPQNIYFHCLYTGSLARAGNAVQYPDLKPRRPIRCQASYYIVQYHTTIIGVQNVTLLSDETLSNTPTKPTGIWIYLQVRLTRCRTLFQLFVNAMIIHTQISPFQDPLQNTHTHVPIYSSYTSQRTFSSYIFKILQHNII